ncbi:interferon-induced protein with tetratricopeptide repeats 2-like [Ptychodera flava]|uniref:interferon-induced protein with tetratricopeptide repeats 2-like n=1 Tax=Ptychodera flava TaxID=63121 RepID=UPI00396A7AC5
MATQTKISLSQVVDVDRNIKQAKECDRMYRDILIEEFSFQFELGRDASKTSYEAILKTLPCYFNWDLEESTDEDVQVLVGCAKENLVSNTELSLVPHKTMLGYLYVSQLRRTEDKEPSTALSWFDDALSDNLKDIDSCGDNDGPLGDKLILLGNKAWVYFVTGRMDMVDKTLQNIKQISDCKLSEGEKAFIYGHKGMCFAYFLKETCRLSLLCFDRALSIFPNHADWLFWSGAILDIHRMRIYGESFTPEALPLFDRQESFFKRVLQLNNAHPCAMALLSKVYLDRGEFDKAESYILDARKCDPGPTLPIVASIASSVFVTAKKFKMSEQALEQSLQIWPKNTYSLLFMGNTYKEMHFHESTTESNQMNLKKAIQYYDKANMCVDHHLPGITIEKAKVYTVLGNLAEARGLFSAVASTARDPFWKSVAYLEFGEFFMHHLRESCNAMKYYKMASEHGAEYWVGKKAAALLDSKV